MHGIRGFSRKFKYERLWIEGVSAIGSKFEYERLGKDGVNWCVAVWKVMDRCSYNIVVDESSKIKCAK